MKIVDESSISLEEGSFDKSDVLEKSDQGLDQALMELEVILDSGNESLKRLYEEPLRPLTKRIKMSESLNEIVEAVKIKKVLRKMM